MTWLKEFFFSFWHYLMVIIGWLIEIAADVFDWLIYALYDGFLTIVATVVSALDIPSDFFSLVANYSSLPPQLIWIINTVNLPQGIGYIVTAIIIRMGMNLIPAALTRI